jgi:signal transduction histidine kinase
VVISDTGLGIRQDYLERITQTFFTVKAEREEDSLGFAITQEIVARHKGKLEIQSSPGERTTATIWLPVAGTEKSSV